MKFVKGVAVFLVCCLAAYGAFAILKRPPKLEIPEGDRTLLAGMGIYTQETQPTASGLSPILSDVEGVAPVGMSFGGGSSAPPSFLTEHTASSVPPSFMTEPTPFVATASIEPLSAQDVSPPVIETLPPPVFVEFPIQEPPVVVPPVTLPPVDVPLVNTSVYETTSFDAPPLEILVPPSESSWSAVPLIPVAESPPPWTENWDGPALGIPEIPPPQEFLQSHTPPRVIYPNPLARTQAATQSPALERIAYQPTVEYAQTVASNVRIVESAQPSVSPWAPVREETGESFHAFSSSDSVPLESAVISNTRSYSLDTDPTSISRYTQTSARKPPVFEPIKPAMSLTGTVVAFACPNTMPQQPETPQPEQPAAAYPVMVSPAAVKATVTPIGPPRLIENTPPPVASPSTREMVKQFVQSQRQLAESGDSENIRQAFIQLSKLYEHRLEDSERAMMQPVLDSLARKVIYARETHILEPPHRVAPGETIVSIANDFDVTPNLLRKINGLGMTQEVSAGTLLKVVYGQFDARISFQRRELTLLLGGLYAGRFSFSLPNEGMPVRKGEFYVTGRTDRTVTLNNGWVLATESARNATIVLSDMDAREIFNILSEQSVIVVE